MTLVYNSRRVVPQRLVQLDATHPSGGGAAPVRMSLRLQRADGSWVTFYQGMSEIHFRSGAGTTRLAAWFDDAPYDVPTATSYTAHVTSHFGDGTTAASAASVRVLSAYSYDAGPYGHGWSLAGLERLHPQADGGLLLSAGDGSVSYFAPCATGCSTHVSPAGDFSTLTRPQLGTDRWYERKAPDGSVAEYDNVGRLRRVRDRFGNATTFAYSGSTAAVTSVTDPAGKVTTLAYDGAGRLDYIRDPASRTTQVTVDGNGDLTQVVRPDGVAALTVSYTIHLPITWYDAKGGQWDYAWANYGRYHTLYAPAVVANGVTQRPATGFRSLETVLFASMDSGRGTAGNPAQRLTPADVRVSTTTPRGHTTSFTLDRFGAPLRVEEPLGRTTVMTRNAHSQVTTTTAPNGHVLTYTWDGPRLTTMNDAAYNRSQTLTYDSITGDLKESQGTMAPYAEYFWSAGKVDSARTGSPTEPATRYSYRPDGRVLTVTEPAGHTTSYTYGGGIGDNLSRIAREGHSSLFVYDSAGRVTQASDNVLGTTRRGYDVLNRPLWEAGTNADTTRFTHDALYLTQVRDAIGQTYTFHRNSLGWLTQRVDPRSKSSTFAYDAAGNVTQTVDRHGRMVTFAYDALDQLTGETDVSAVVTTAHHTDPLGRFVATANAESVDTLWFDRAGRDSVEVTRRGAQRYVRRRGWNARDQQTSIAGTSATGWSYGVAYGYTALGQLENLTDAANATTTIAYDGRHMPSLRTLGSGVTEFLQPIGTTPLATYTLPGREYDVPALNTALGVRRAFDDAGRLRTRWNGAMSGGTEYEYSAQNRIQRERSFEILSGSPCPVPVYTADGDAANPLGYDCASTTRQYLSTRTHSFDRVGNPNAAGIQLQTGNRVAQAYSVTYQHDDEGNRTSAVAGSTLNQSFSWNGFGQLASVNTTVASGGSTGLVAYGYDGWGRRVRRSLTRGGVTTTTGYLHAGDHVVAELSAAGAVVADYAWHPGVDAPHSMRRGSQIYYYTQEPTGNVTALLGPGETVANRYAYTAFGELTLVQETVPNPFRFKGTAYDSTARLYHMRARDYDPGLGRFVSEDPIGLEGGINPYAFAGNDPVNNGDPSGLDCVRWSDWQFERVSEDHYRAWRRCELQALEPVMVIADGGGPGGGGDAWPSGFGGDPGPFEVLGGGGSLGRSAWEERAAAQALQPQGIGPLEFLPIFGIAGRTSRAGLLTAPQAADLARYLGYSRTRSYPFNPHGQSVFTNGRHFISQDVDSHIGGTWKMHNRRGERMGTFDHFLTFMGW